VQHEPAAGFGPAHVVHRLNRGDSWQYHGNTDALRDRMAGFRDWPLATVHPAETMTIMGRVMLDEGGAAG